MDSPDSGTLHRTVRLLRCFVDQQTTWGVRELARTVGFHHATTHRLLKGLAAEGLLQFDQETQRYSVGVELYRMGLVLSSRSDVASIARPHMRHLARLTREGIYLCLYVDGKHELIMAATEESDYPLRYIPELYRYLPLHAGATGRSILAFLPDETIREVMRQTGLQRITANTIVDEDQWWVLLMKTRAQGYALSFGERVPETAALGAPIRDAANRVVGSIVLVMPHFRWDPAREQEWAGAVVAAAGATSRALGGTGRRP